MYQLSDLYSKIIRKPLQSGSGIACEKLDADTAVLNRQLTERCSMYSFNLVTEGWATIIYCGKEISLRKNDLFIHTPGATIYTKDVSDDYAGWCLMCDESTAYSIPFARKIVTASYLPLMTNDDNKLPLTDIDTVVMDRRMDEINSYMNAEHCYKDESLQALYSIFVLDLLNIENKYTPIQTVNLHLVDLFLRFLKLLNENYITRHDLDFYAGTLSVTSIYLSRVVKRLSNQTIKNHIDRLLTMEACFRLTNSDTPVAQIAVDLNFANPASFCKFFSRQKGMSPREYRNKFL